MATTLRIFKGYITVRKCSDQMNKGEDTNPNNYWNHSNNSQNF